MTTNSRIPEPAGIGRRVLAALIDILILAATLVFIAAVFGDWDTSTKQPGDDEAWLSFSLTGTSVVVYGLFVVAYHWLLEGLTGRTFGKVLLGLRVTGLKGSPYTIGKAFLRNLLRIVDGLPVLHLAGFLVAITKQEPPENRRYCGRYAGHA